jgi:hypothetical protein
MKGGKGGRGRMWREMELGKGGSRKESRIRDLVLPFERVLDLKFPRRGTWHIRSNTFPENKRCVLLHSVGVIP